MGELQNRTKRIQMMVSEKEKTRIEQRAEEVGLSASSYLRRLVLQDLKQVRKQAKEAANVQ